MFSFLNRIPPVTKNLLLINVAMYIVNQVFFGMGNDLSPLLGSHFILSPSFEPFQVVTHMFMHSTHSIMHLLMNMLFLVVLGPLLERNWGAKHYFIFYFACGFGGFALSNIVSAFEYFNLVDELGLMDINQNSINNAIPFINPWDGDSFVDNLGPLIKTQEQFDVAAEYARFNLTMGVGASGAIFGLMAAFGILHPNTELQLIIPPMPVKVKYLIGIYVLFELYRAFNPVPGDNVAHWAHLGGALVGAIIVLIRRRTNKTNFY